MNNVKVSVIIPVYNVEQYLKQCLDSAVNQTLKDIEIIVVNDGSTDNSLEIIHEYSNKYKNIKVINKRNEGCYKARNIGLETAQGEYIAFLDSDDYIESNMYEKLYLKAKDTDADIVSSSYYISQDNNLKVVDFSSSIKLLEKSNNKLIGAENILLDAVIWSRIFKRQMLIDREIKFHSDIHTADDTFFHIISGLNAKKIVYIPDILYTYRISRNGSITTNLHNEFNFDCIKVSQKILEYVIKNNMKHFMPYAVFVSLRLIVLGYLRIDRNYKNEYFEHVCNFVNGFSINNKTKIAFAEKSYLYNYLCFKFVVHKNKLFLDLLIEIRNFIKRFK